MKIFLKEHNNKIAAMAISFILLSTHILFAEENLRLHIGTKSGDDTYRRMEATISEVTEEHPLIGICWVLTSRCPLKCPKCFAIAGLKDGDFERQKQMIDIIAKSGVRKLTFAGGEPLLVPHVIDLIEYAHKKALSQPYTLVA